MSAKRAKAERNKAGECIFCGQVGNMSKQHIWPDWLKEIFPRINDSHLFERYGIQLTNNIVHPFHEKHKKNGHQGTAKVRKLCQTCNNGWVSALENELKPTFTALSKAVSITLDPKEMELLSKWAIISSMVNEIADNAIPSIPDSDRHFLYTNRNPTSNWTVWIARNGGLEWQHQQIRNRKIALPENLSDYGKGYRYEKKNTILSAFGIGTLLVITCRLPWPDVSFEFNFPPGQKLIRLWPLTYSIVDWTQCPPMSDEEINSLFDFFKDKLTYGQRF